MDEKGYGWWKCGRYLRPIQSFMRISDVEQTQARSERAGGRDGRLVFGGAMHAQTATAAATASWLRAGDAEWRVTVNKTQRPPHENTHTV